MKSIDSLCFGGHDVLPLVEGGKGVAVSTGVSAGHWAAAGGIGTLSAVNADSYDAQGCSVPQVYRARTRRERQQELVRYAIDGGIAQAKIAHDISGGKGRIHANILWEMGGAEEVITGILEAVPGLIHGVTCGAGMPYRLSDIAVRFNIPYYPIVSSGRAFNALWRRAYSKHAALLGGVVYEDPWRAGGHNGLSNTENPLMPEDPLPRVVELRRAMRQYGLDETPIIMAGGVWRLDEWQDWIGNSDLGPVAFQFGTRPLLTQESPIPAAWKRRLQMLQPGDIYLNRFSPTGFYSSAVKNRFLQDLCARSERQVSVRSEADDVHDTLYEMGARRRQFFVSAADRTRIATWEAAGFTQAMPTPDETFIFVTPDDARTILADQAACMGCLSVCRFSNWMQREPFTTGHKADPRSFCIQKTLQAIAHAPNDEHAETIVDDNLMFGGTIAHRFATDPFYANGFVPTVGQLVERILTGQ